MRVYSLYCIAAECMLDMSAAIVAYDEGCGAAFRHVLPFV
jgi:hypothetical protein